LGPRRTFTARVVDNTPLNPDHLLLTFDPPADVPPPRPGQFYMVEVGTGVEPLLRRPFCYFRSVPEGIQLLVRVRGKGTALMRKLRPGSPLGVLGPLGNSYPMPPRGRKPVIVAGGVAVASVFPHVERLGKRATVILGARSSADLMMAEELGDMAGELHVTTEDGSVGTRGTVMDALRDLAPGEDRVLCACGPRGMTRAVADYARERGLRGYASLEEFMACGIGACMGCVVRTVKGYRRVCKEGPIFRLEEVLL
jgi:dihydroorotate dehydrogenase electron transfer subunit